MILFEEMNKLLNTIKTDQERWKLFQSLSVEKEIPSKTVLLREGEISNTIYFIKKGCIREWFNKDGKEITFQFFFDEQPVASIESFMNQKPSLFTIETIEPSQVMLIKREWFNDLLDRNPDFKIGFQDFLFKRLGNYSQLFLSRIKDSPQERYEELLKKNPEIIKRVPQHYIASFLGITPISLSRIRNRKY